MAEAEKFGWDSIQVLALNRIAYVHLKTKNFESMQEALQGAISVGGDHYPDEMAFSYSALGRMYLNSEEFETAHAYFLKALEMNLDIHRTTGIADTYFYVGIVEYELAKAKEKTLWISRLWPNKKYSKALNAFDRGIAHAMLRDSDAAENQLKMMNIKNHIGRALVFKSRGNAAEACTVMQTAAAIDPSGELTYNPMTTDLVSRIGCHFLPLNFAPADT